MKTKSKILALTIAAMLCFTAIFAACEQQHVHNWITKSDSQQHWKECIDDQEEKPDSRQAHSDEDNDGRCDVCGFFMTPTSGSGTGSGTDHEHSFTGEWKFDSTHHWKQCSCGETGLESPHVDENKDNKCDVCKLQLGGDGHQHSFDMQHNDSEHWKQCSCGVTTDHESHSFDSNGTCSVCHYTKPSGGEHRHTFVNARNATQHWTVCSQCGEETPKQNHSQAANYLCSCGYAFDAPATGGLQTKNFWIIGTFTDDKGGGVTGWGETHTDQWKFHRLAAKDDNGSTQYVFEREFAPNDAFKIVSDANGGYWDDQLNAGNVSQQAKNYLGGNGGGNIEFIGKKGYYRITVHYGEDNTTVDCTLIFGDEGETEPHVHTYASTWTSDESGHWHASTCEHGELRKDMSNHEYGDGMTCHVCGYVQPHVCQTGETWVSSKTEHYKLCVLCNRLMEETRAPHNGVPCSVCGYELAISGALKLQLNEQQDGYIVTGYDYDLIEEDVRIPDTYNQKTVVAIGQQAFMNCLKIKSVIIPDSITSVGIYAFANCRNLEEVSLGKNIKTIETGAFQYTRIASVTLPSGLQKIGNSAFEYCYLTEVTIPASVNYIGNFAFRNYMGNATPYPGDSSAEDKTPPEVRPTLTKVTFEQPNGWTIYPLAYELDKTVQGITLNLANPTQNAKYFNETDNPDYGFNGYAQYIWVRG